jgi:hypothetical protein
MNLSHNCETSSKGPVQIPRYQATVTPTSSPRWWPLRRPLSATKPQATAADTGTIVPRASAHQRGPLSLARLELADASQELAIDTAAFERCKQPVGRLRGLMQDCADAELGSRHRTDAGFTLSGQTKNIMPLCGMRSPRVDARLPSRRADDGDCGEHAALLHQTREGAVTGSAGRLACPSQPADRCAFLGRQQSI